MKDRNYGIDALKIVSMLMVIALHIFGTGGCLAASAGNKSRYYIFYLLETYSYAAVDIFAIITGYLSVSKTELTIKKVIKRWTQIEFYSLFGMVICILSGLVTYEQINFKMILLPITYLQKSCSFSPILTKSFSSLTSDIFFDVS